MLSWLRSLLGLETTSGLEALALGLPFDYQGRSPSGVMAPGESVTPAWGALRKSSDALEVPGALIQLTPAIPAASLPTEVWATILDIFCNKAAHAARGRPFHDELGAPVLSKMVQVLPRSVAHSLSCFCTGCH